MSAIQFAAAGTPAQVLAAIEEAMLEEATTIASRRLGVVGVTGISPTFGLSIDVFAWIHADTPLDAPELIPTGHMMPSGQSWFSMRGQS